MAEGGGEFGRDDNDLIEFNDDDEQEVDRTGRFQPGAASTPYHNWEKLEMQPLVRGEQDGTGEIPAPPSFVEITPDKEGIIKRARDFIKKRFPRVDFAKLGPIGISKKGTGDIVSFGPKGDETKIFKANNAGFSNTTQTDSQHHWAPVLKK